MKDDDSMIERWRPIPGIDGYDVSDWGRVQTYHRAGRPYMGKPRRALPQVLRTRPGNEHGHLMVSILRNGERVTVTVHSLVLFAFVGPRPEGLWCRHLNDNPTDNRVENLKWGTPTENRADSVRNGGADVGGVLSPKARLTEAEVRRIRERYADGSSTQRDLARQHCVSVQTICSAINRKTYRDVV